MNRKGRVGGRRRRRDDTRSCGKEEEGSIGFALSLMTMIKKLWEEMGWHNHRHGVEVTYSRCYPTITAALSGPISPFPPSRTNSPLRPQPLLPAVPLSSSLTEY